MSLKALIELANRNPPIPEMSPAAIQEWQKRMTEWDKGVEERMRARVLSTEQLQKHCDYHARNP